MRVLTHPSGIAPKCADEKAKAQAARHVTLAYMQDDAKLEASRAFDKYGRLLVRGPHLKKQRTEKGLAKPIKGRRAKWCD